MAMTLLYETTQLFIIDHIIDHARTPCQE